MARKNRGQVAVQVETTPLEAIFPTEPAGFMVKEDLVAMKRRKPSSHERDETGKVIRAGRNLSGNSPFRYKYYYLASFAANEAEWTAEYKIALDAAPNQVKLILRSMREAGNTSPDNAAIGKEIVDQAKANNLLVTKIESAVLFAYYRKLMEGLGLRQA